MPTQRLKKLTLVKPVDPNRVAQGRVTHDSRGNAVWHWDIDTGVLARKPVAELLTSLDAPGALALDAEIERHGDWSGDPYNRNR